MFTLQDIEDDGRRMGIVFVGGIMCVGAKSATQFAFEVYLLCDRKECFHRFGYVERKGVRTKNAVIGSCQLGIILSVAYIPNYSLVSALVSSLSHIFRHLLCLPA